MSWSRSWLLGSGITVMLGGWWLGDTSEDTEAVVCRDLVRGGFLPPGPGPGPGCCWMAKLLLRDLGESGG